MFSLIRAPDEAADAGEHCFKYVHFTRLVKHKLRVFFFALWRSDSEVSDCVELVFALARFSDTGTGVFDSCVFSASAPLPYWDFDRGIFRHSGFCRDVPSELPPRRRLDSGQVHEMEKKGHLLHFQACTMLLMLRRKIGYKSEW
jgi:hypothetical protein